MSLINRAKSHCFILLLIVMASSCEEEGTENKSTPLPLEPAIELDTFPDSSDTEIEFIQPEFPKLDSTNAVDFLTNYFQENKERKIQLSTRVGTLKVRLFDDTPLHTANFLMMTKREYYNGTEFIRVVPNFVVQGGNNESETEEIKRLLIGTYKIPAEFKDHHIHKKGVLAMARSYENNPKKKSSAYYFYFVQGQKFNEPQLLALERDHEMQIPEWKRKVYKEIGGAPHLDGQHTVFGEIYEGLEILDKMAAVPTDKGDWPLEALEMKVEVINE